jgi:ATP-dependent Lon protease
MDITSESNLPSMEYIQQVKMQFQRNQRNHLLGESDKYILSDFPLNEDQRNEIKIYRKSLRDYFGRDDVINWTYDKEIPTFPSLPYQINNLST